MFVSVISHSTTLKQLSTIHWLSSWKRHVEEKKKEKKVYGVEDFSASRIIIYDIRISQKIINHSSWLVLYINFP